MCNRALILSWMVLALLLMAPATVAIGQERERGSSEAKTEEMRRLANQMEQETHKLMERRQKIIVELEKINRREHPDRHDELFAHRKELDAAIANTRNEFAAVMRQRNQDRETENARARHERRRAEEMENQLKQNMEHLKAIDVWLESDKDQGNNQDKREQLMARRHELMAQIEQAKAHFAEIRARKLARDRERREVEQIREREGDDVNKNIHAALEKLEHLEHAHVHLQEAGMKDIAQSVQDQANKIRQWVKQIREHREREELAREKRGRARERDQSRRVQTNSDEAFRKEVLGAIRELNSAVKSLRQEVEQLRKQGR